LLAVFVDVAGYIANVAPSIASLSVDNADVTSFKSVGGFYKIVAVI